MVIIGALIFFTCAVGIPWVLHARKTAHRLECLFNLMIIDSATEGCGCAENWRLGDHVNVARIVNYIKGYTLPRCPSGGT